jgi:hypothetical protein
MICGDCVDELGGERPLEIKDGCFGVALEETVVGVGGVGTP